MANETITNGAPEAGAITKADMIYEKLPAHVTFADIQMAGGPRGSAIRRWLRDNVAAYNERQQRNTVLDKVADKELIMLLLGRVGAGTQAGLKVPDRKDNGAILASLKPKSETPAQETPAQETPAQDAPKTPVGASK